MRTKEQRRRFRVRLYAHSMSPSTIAALGRARAAAGFYVFSWGACIVFAIAAAVSVPVFTSLLDVDERRVAIGLLGVFAGIVLLLPLLGDAALALTLPLLARTTGRTGVRPVVVALLVVLALTVPLLATAAAVSIVKRAFDGVERAPPFPSTNMTLAQPIAAWFAGSVVCIVVVVVFAPEPPVVVALVSGLGMVFFAGLRIRLGLALRAAFSELLSRPAVDDMHASRTEPVAGG